MKVAVLGAGSWGTALSILLARNGHDVMLAGRSGDELDVLRSTRENSRYLPGFPIPQSVSFQSLTDDLGSPDMTVIAVPSSGVRSVVSNICGSPKSFVIAAKGLEGDSGKRMSEVVAESCPGPSVGSLSGPNLAVEIVRGIPTAAVVASPDPSVAEAARSAFMCSTFRVYSSDDVIGVELAGSLKNVLAIGAGMSDGLGFGDNTKGALLARGLREMSALGLTLGARMETFMGLAGVGDLFATAVSRLSRNYRVGRALGEGQSLSSALESVGQVAEGVDTSAAALRLAERVSLEVPVFTAIDSVIHGRLSPLDGVRALMDRAAKCEA